MFIGERGTGQSRSFAIREDIQQGRRRTGRVGGGKLKVASPGEAKFVDLVRREVGGPIGDEEAFVSSPGAVLSGAAVVDGGSGVIAQWLLPVLPVEHRADAIGVVELVVQLAEENVLLELAGKR